MCLSNMDYICICEHPASLHEFIEVATVEPGLPGTGSWKSHKCGAVKTVSKSGANLMCKCASLQISPFQMNKEAV